MEAYNERLGHFKTLRDVCKARDDKRVEILEKMGSQYSGVYVNNQAACIADSGYHPELRNVHTESYALFINGDILAEIEIVIW